MIRITCTQCKAELSIDEAFAGGVCRCQHCGTIQTVPKHLKNGAAAGVSVKAGAARSGATGSGRGKPSSKIDTGLSSGLDALAEVLASSNLTGSGLSSSNPRRSTLADRDRAIVAPSPRANKMILIVVSAGIVIVLLLGVVIGLLLKNNAGQKSSEVTVQPQGSAIAVPAPNKITKPDEILPVIPPPTIAPKVEGPSFFGVPINEPTVIFILDRGTSTREAFEPMKTASLNALDTLKPAQKYQVIFWKIDKDLAAYPKGLAAASDKVELKKLAAWMDDVNSYGVSDVRPALDMAFRAHPAAIVIASGKPLDDSFITAVMDSRKSANVKVHCLSLVEPASNKAMTEVAKKTGGTFKFVSLSELRSVTR